MDVRIEIIARLVDLFFEIWLKLTQVCEVGLGMESLDAPQVIRKQASQIIFPRAVKEDPDVYGLAPHQVGDVLDQKERALFQLGVVRHVISASALDFISNSRMVLRKNSSHQ